MDAGLFLLWHRQFLPDKLFPPAATSYLPASGHLSFWKLDFLSNPL